jgi:UDP-N-acetylmuramyl pentapeptide phosphotransferase/UDP-N-acetylglucosamine-1-phosphate transferase
MSPNLLLIAAAVAVGAGAFLAARGTLICRQWNLRARAMGGKREPRPVALGIAVFGGFLLPLIYYVGFALSARGDQYYPLETQRLLVAVLYFTSLALLAWGWRCDRGRGGLETILVLWAVQAALWSAGLRIDRLGFGFLPGQEEALVQLPLWLSFFLTLFTLTLIASVIELLDGIDGLAALATGAASLAVFTHAFVSGGDGDLFVQLFAWLLMVIALLAAWLGRPGGRLLLGKNGAFLLGHWLAILLVLARQKEATAKILTPFLILGLIAAVILLRFIERSLGFHLRKAGTKGQGKKEMANGE